MSKLSNNPFYRDPQYHKASYGQEPTVMSNLAIAWEVRKLREAIEQLAPQNLSVDLGGRKLAKAITEVEAQYKR